MSQTNDIVKARLLVLRRDIAEPVVLKIYDFVEDFNTAIQLLSYSQS